MDHHCHLLECCIGYNNYKFYILTIFYLTILLGFAFLDTLKGILYLSVDYTVIKIINYKTSNKKKCLFLLTFIFVFYVLIKFRIDLFAITRLFSY